MIRNPRHKSRFATNRVASQEQLKEVLNLVRSITGRFITAESKKLEEQVNRLEDHLPIEELNEAYLSATGRELDTGRFLEAYENIAYAIDDYSEVIFSMLRDIENGRH